MCFELPLETLALYMVAVQKNTIYVDITVDNLVGVFGELARKGMIRWQENNKKPPSSGVRKAVKRDCHFNDFSLCFEKGYLPLVTF
jgi:hypothetical protein